MSACNASDVPRLRTEDVWLVDGVNVKMEKAGGPRAMVETALRQGSGYVSGSVSRSHLLSTVALQRNC